MNELIPLVAIGLAAWWFFNQQSSSASTSSSQSVPSRTPTTVTTMPASYAPYVPSSAPTTWTDSLGFQHTSAPQSANIIGVTSSGQQYNEGTVGLPNVPIAEILQFTINGTTQTGNGANADPNYPSNMTPAMWMGYFSKIVKALLNMTPPDPSQLFPTFGTDLTAPMDWATFSGRMTAWLTQSGLSGLSGLGGWRV